PWSTRLLPVRGAHSHRWARARGTARNNGQLERTACPTRRLAPLPALSRRCRDVRADRRETTRLTTRSPSSPDAQSRAAAAAFPPAFGERHWLLNRADRVRRRARRISSRVRFSTWLHSIGRGRNERRRHWDADRQLRGTPVRRRRIASTTAAHWRDSDELRN